MTLSQDLLDSGAVTLRRRGDEIVAGDGPDRRASVRAGSISLGDRPIEVRAGRGYEALVDAGTGSRLATIRRRAHGPVAVEAGVNRYRITRHGLRFWTRDVTHEAGGATVLRALRFGPFVRVVTTDATAGFPPAELDLLVLALVHTWFGLGPDATRAEAGIDVDAPRAGSSVPAPAPAAE